MEAGQIYNTADIVFEQTEDFYFIVRKNRLGEKYSMLSAGELAAEWDNGKKITIIDYRGTILSKNF